MYTSIKSAIRKSRRTKIMTVMIRTLTPGRVTKKSRMYARTKHVHSANIKIFYLSKRGL